MRTELLTDINEFLAATGLSGSHFGKLAVGNARLVERLQRGGRVWPETEALIRDFIKSEASKRATTLNRAA